MDFGERLRAATAAHQAGDLDAAEAAYLAVLAEDPDQPDALHFLGLAAFQRGDEARAIALIGRSIAAFPDNAAAHNNLGNVLKEAGRREDAIGAYKAAIRIDPHHVDSWNNIGVLLREATNLDKAAEVFGHVVAAAPGHAEAWHNLGVTELMRGRLEASAAAFEAGLDLGQRRWSDPVWNAAVLCALGRRERAADLLESYLSRNPGDAVALHQLAAIRGEAPARASDAYLREHFDRFAGSFDEVLFWLGYRAPRLVADAVARHAGERGALDVVDLGCGTGLCGPLIRPHCRRLVGVDLSPGMLRRAARRGVYDALVEAELVDFLQRTRESFDLAVAADVLIYFGALEPVMAALATALRPGGGLIATVERLSEEAEGPGHRIDPSGRYAHRASHLRAAAESAGLALSSVEAVVLRKELDRQVEGLLFTVTRPEATPA